MNKTGFGFSRLPLTDADDNKAIDFAQVCQLTDLALKSNQNC